jgi:hypothetical protein
MTRALLGLGLTLTLFATGCGGMEGPEQPASSAGTNATSGGGAAVETTTAPLTSAPEATPSLSGCGVNGRTREIFIGCCDFHHSRYRVQMCFDGEWFDYATECINNGTTCT